MSTLPNAISGIDRRKLKNIVWMVLLNGVTLVSGLVLMTVMARHLGPDRLATYAWLFSLVTLAAPLAVSVEPIATRLIVERPSEKSSIIGATLALHLVGALLGTSIIVAVAASGGPPGTSPFLAFGASILLFAYCIAGFDTWFRAQERIDLVAAPKAVGQILGALAGLALAFAGAGVAAFVWLRSLQTMASSLAAAWLYVRQNGRGSIASLRLRRDSLMRVFSESWPLVLSGMASVAHLRVDQVMLGWMAPAYELANYSIAARLAEILLVVPGILHAAFFPSLIQANARNQQGFEAHMQRYFDLHGLAGWFGAVSLWIGAWLLFVPVFGVAYAGGVSIAFTLACVIPVQLLVSSRDTMLSIKGDTRTILRFALVGLAVNLAANSFLIPLYGGQGAATATVLSVCISALLTAVPPSLRPVGMRLLRALVPWGALRRVAALAAQRSDE